MHRPAGALVLMPRSLLCSVRIRSKWHQFLAVRLLLTASAPAAGESLAALGLPGLPEDSGLPLHITGTPDSPSLEVAGCAPQHACMHAFCHAFCTVLFALFCTGRALPGSALPCPCRSMLAPPLPKCPPGRHKPLLPPTPMWHFLLLAAGLASSWRCWLPSNRPPSCQAPRPASPRQAYPTHA
jgi:hypothetical protein